MPTGMAKMFPANPVMAWTVYAKKNRGQEKRFFHICYNPIYVTSLQV